MFQPSTGKDEVRITGVLVDRPVVVFNPGDNPRAFFFAELRHSSDRGRPYLIRQDLGKDPNEHNAAKAKARALSAGQEVTVYASYIDDASDHGKAKLILHGVRDVIPSSSTLADHTSAATQE